VWEYSYKMLQLAQLLGQVGVFLTLLRHHRRESKPSAKPSFLRIFNAF
jgi:hypothetical protein